MAITAGSDILASDFINASAGVGSAAHGVVTDSAGKIDPSFLYPVVPSITAQSNVSAGNLLKLISGGVAPIGAIQNQVLQNTGTTIAADSIYDAIYLNSTTVAVFFDNISSGNIRYYSLVVGTISGSVITWGTVVLLQTENQGGSPRDVYTPLRLTQVSSTCFVASFAHQLSGVATQEVDAYVCTFSGTTITAGSVQHLGTSGYQPVDVCSPSNDAIAYSLYPTSGTLYPYAVAGTINESTRAITAGSILQISSTANSISNDNRIHLLSSNRMLVTYFQSGTTMYYGVLTLSGTTLSIVSHDNTNGNLSASGRFVQGATENTGIYVTTAAFYLSESSGTITISSFNIFVSVKSIINPISVYDSANNIFLIVTTTSNTVSLVQCTSAGCSLIITTKITTGLNAITSNGCRQFIEVDPATSGGNWLANVIGTFDWNFVIGFAQSTKTAGNPVLVNITGQMETNQSGLFLGLDYYASPSGGITVNPTTTINGIIFTNKKVGRAYSATALAVNI
jgi:hypothetical protein